MTFLQAARKEIRKNLKVRNNAIKDKYMIACQDAI